MIHVLDSIGGVGLLEKRFHQHIARLLEGTWKDYKRRFKRCRGRFSESSVHKLRVESRRLLALLRLLEPLVGPATVEPPYRLVKKGLRRLARLRDTQVQLLAVGQRVGEFPEAKPFKAALRERARRLVREANAWMDGPQIRKLRSCMRVLQEQVEPIVADSSHEREHYAAQLRSVKQAFAKVVALRQRCRPEDPETIHRLRIAFKAFRYRVELLRPVLPGVTQRDLLALHTFQTRLGAIQDADVLVASLTDYAREHPEEATSLDRLHRDAVRRLSELISRFLAAPDRIRQFAPPDVLGRNRLEHRAGEPVP